MESLLKEKRVIGLESIGNRRKFIIREGKEKIGGMKEELGAGDEGREAFMIHHILGNETRD